MTITPTFFSSRRDWGATESYKKYFLARFWSRTGKWKCGKTIDEAAFRELTFTVTYLNFLKCQNNWNFMLFNMQCSDFWSNNSVVFYGMVLSDISHALTLLIITKSWSDFFSNIDIKVQWIENNNFQWKSQIFFS